MPFIFSDDYVLRVSKKSAADAHVILSQDPCPHFVNRREKALK